MKLVSLIGFHPATSPTVLTIWIGHCTNSAICLISLKDCISYFLRRDFVWTSVLRNLTLAKGSSFVEHVFFGSIKQIIIFSFHTQLLDRWISTNDLEQKINKVLTFIWNHFIKILVINLQIVQTYWNTEIETMYINTHILASGECIIVLTMLRVW